jgi:hypothetical protein
MTDLPEPDDQTFRLATGEEVDLFSNDAPPSSMDEETLDAAPSSGPPRPTYRDRRTASRLRARKVRRLVRHVEPWSVLKISLIFYFCLWVVFLIAGVILWSLAVGSGTIDNLESFIEGLLALDSFEFKGDQIFRASALGGLVLVVAGSGFTVLVAVLFNLISDVTGGIRITVVDASSETHTADVTFTIANINDAPESLQIIGLVQGQTVKEEDKILLRGSAQDIDDDASQLVYKWYAKGVLIGQTQDFTWKVKGKGLTEVKLIVSDGAGSDALESSYSVNVTVKEIEEPPGFEAIFVMAAIAVIGIIAVVSRRRKM